MTLFEYLYRDGGNFKAFGRVALEGELTASEQCLLRACFNEDGHFVAEQIDVPPLYRQLYQWSGGPTGSDHCWHEFVALKVVTDSDVPPGACRWGTSTDFLRCLRSIADWDGSMSPHFQ